MYVGSCYKMDRNGHSNAEAEASFYRCRRVENRWRVIGFITRSSFRATNFEFSCFSALSRNRFEMKKCREMLNSKKKKGTIPNIQSSARFARRTLKMITNGPTPATFFSRHNRESQTFVRLTKRHTHTSFTICKSQSVHRYDCQSICSIAQWCWNYLFLFLKFRSIIDVIQFDFKKKKLVFINST